jgi:hypothetical protein
MLTRRELANYAASGRRAYGIVDVIFADVMIGLRKDSRFRAVSTFDLELLLADARRNVESLLLRELRDRIHLDDIWEDR